MNKQIFLVRNPVDTIYSQFLLNQFKSQNIESTNSFKDDFPDMWDRFVERYSNYWNKYTQTGRKFAKQVPTFFLRYEDLILNPEKSLSELMMFLLDVPSIEGTIV